MWKLSNILLNNQWVTQITKEIRKYFETNESEDTVYKTYRMQLKRAWKFIAVNTYILKSLSHLNFYLMSLEKEQTNLKASRWKEILGLEWKLVK